MKYLKKLNEFLETVLEKSTEEQDFFAQKILSAMGYNIQPKLLGEGGNGSAFDIGDKVFKITRDKAEAVNAVKSMGKGLKHFATYDVVDRIELDENISDERLAKLSSRGLFALILDKVKVFEQGSIISKLLNSFTCPSDAGDLQNRFANFGTKEYTTKEGTHEWNFEVFKNINTLEKVCERGKLDQKNTEIQNYYSQLVEMMRESMESGIRLVDMDYGNLGLKGNTVVVFDMGGLGAVDKSESKQIISSMKVIHVNGDIPELFKK